MSKFALATNSSKHEGYTKKISTLQNRELLRLLFVSQRVENVNGEAIVHVILQEALHCSVDIVNGNIFHVAHDALFPAEVQHLLSLLNAANQAAANRQPAQKNMQHRHVLLTKTMTLVHQTMNTTSIAKICHIGSTKLEVRTSSHAISREGRL